MKEEESKKTSRISDAEWERREADYLKPFVGFECALKIAKRNVKKRDIYDRVRAK